MSWVAVYLFIYRSQSNFPSQLCPSLPSLFQAHLVTVCFVRAAPFSFTSSLQPSVLPRPHLCSSTGGKIQHLLKINLKVAASANPSFHCVPAYQFRFWSLCTSPSLRGGGSLMVSPWEQEPHQCVFLQSTVQFCQWKGYFDTVVWCPENVFSIFHDGPIFTYFSVWGRFICARAHTDTHTRIMMLPITQQRLDPSLIWLVRCLLGIQILVLLGWLCDERICPQWCLYTFACTFSNNYFYFFITLLTFTGKMESRGTEGLWWKITTLSLIPPQLAHLEMTILFFFFLTLLRFNLRMYNLPIKVYSPGVPLWHSRLRILCCHYSCCGTSSIPGLGPSMWWVYNQKKKVCNSVFCFGLFTRLCSVHHGNPTLEHFLLL